MQQTMGLLEDVPELYMIIAVVVAVSLVAVTVFIIFWFGLGRQRTFEEAKAIASRQADLVLQEEHKNSPRAKKGKKQFTRKKKVGQQWEEPQQEETIPESQVRKGILKPSSTPDKEPTPERSPRIRVGFNIDVPTDESKSSHSNPPTPHPHKSAAPVFKVREAPRTPQPLFEEPEEEEEEAPPTKPPAPVSKPPTVEGGKKSSTDSPRSGAGQRRRQRPKKESGEAAAPTDEGLPASRIVDIVGASSLSDEDIQQLVSVLLEKMNTNSEWEAANLRSESVKSLKKYNQELQRRCEEAEKTVTSHHSKIKELRAEIQNEKLKNQANDAKLQAKITAHLSELSTVKAQLSRAEEEHKQLKAHSSSVSLEKLEEEKTQLRVQIRQLTGQSQTLSSQVKDLGEENAGLKTELHRTKEALKAGHQSRGGDKTVELESLVRGMEDEKQQLQFTLQGLSDENSRLKAETASMKTALGELEGLKTRADDLEAANRTLSDDKAALMEQLRSEEEAAQRATDAGDALRTEYEEKMDQEVASVRGELTNQMTGLQRRVTELEEQCGAKDREAEELTSQINKCSSLRDQLKALSDQLVGEQTAKKARCKAAKRDTLSETQDRQRQFLTQLFPMVTVEEDEFSKWLDQFEVKVQTILTDKDQEVRTLQAKVTDLQENEEQIVQKAEVFRETLQATTDILGRLQSEVEGRNTEHQRILKEKEQMIERERSTNRGFQEELRKEQKVNSTLRADLQSASQSSSQLEEAQTQLREAEHQHELSRKEADSLRHSLKNELEMKDKVQAELEELQEQKADIEQRLSASEKEAQEFQEQLTAAQSETQKLNTQLQTLTEQAQRAKTPPSPAVHTEV